MNIPESRVVYSQRRSVAIEISSDGGVLVKAPLFTPKFIINKFIASKKDWIEKALFGMKQKKSISRRYKEGEEFLFLGKTYSLKFYVGIKIGFKDNFLFFPQASVFRIQKELQNWYQKQAEIFIKKRVKFHADKMNVKFGNIFFSDTKTKWGTCFPDNSLQFNWRIIMAPVMVLDYVVIHELVHTREKNHKQSFWSKVRLFTPAYKQHRKWLNDNADLMVV